MELRYLNKFQIFNYFDEGYLIIKNLFFEDEVELMRSSFERLIKIGMELPPGVQQHLGSEFAVEEKNGTKGVKRISWCGAIEKDLLDYGGDKRLLNIAHDILESEEFEQLVNQAHYKLPNDQIEFKWHQDSSNRRYGTDAWKPDHENGCYVQMITALDDMTSDNGTIECFRESLKFGHIDVHEKNNYDIPREKLLSQKKITLNLSPGDTVIIHPFTIHGSMPNTSVEKRRTFINGFARPGVNFRQYPGEGSCRKLELPPLED